MWHLMFDEPAVESRTARIPLSATSSLVASWAEPPATADSLAGRYYRQLDFSAGQALRLECDAVWPHYEEVIRNRKYVIRQMTDAVLSGGMVKQVVIAGAGWSTLGLELIERYPDVRVYELDRENMLEKRMQLAMLHDERTAHVACIEADLAEIGGVSKALITHGWRIEKPTLLILEGISYYLTRRQLADLADLARFAGKDSRLIVEYLLHADEIESGRQPIAEQVFRVIAENCGLPKITRLCAADLPVLLGGEVQARQTMYEIEADRTGQGAFFPTPDSGWIEIARMSLSPF